LRRDQPGRAETIQGDLNVVRHERANELPG
jgi:hypothetical protein